VPIKGPSLTAQGRKTLRADRLGERIMTRQWEFSRLTMLALAAILSGLVGCSAFKEQISPQLRSEVTASTGPAPTPPAKYVVEIRPEKGKPQAIERELTDQLHVQAALEQAGVAKKWPRVQTEIYRPLPSGGWHKMTLEWDRENHQVPPEYDYALLPGDRIVVTQDPTNIVDDIMKRTLEPMGIVTPTKKQKLADKYKDKYQIRG